MHVLTLVYCFLPKIRPCNITILLAYRTEEFANLPTDKLNPDHRPHDGRKHFVTKCKDAKVDEYAIKYMVGHKISDITEKVYTAREFEWLRTEIEKIK